MNTLKKLFQNKIDESSLARIWQRLKNRPEYENLPDDKLQKIAYREYLKQESVSLNEQSTDESPERHLKWAKAHLESGDLINHHLCMHNYYVHPDFADKPAYARLATLHINQALSYLKAKQKENEINTSTQNVIDTPSENAKLQTNSYIPNYSDKKKINENVDLTAHSPINAYVEAIKADMKFTDRMIFENANDSNLHPAITEFASQQHDNWRNGWKKQNGGKSPPRIKKNSDGTEGDINVPFNKLHPDWQKENIEAGKAAKKAVEKHGDNEEAAAEHIHNEWMKRNPKADYNAHQHVSYSELSEDEKEKDREHYRTMKKLLNKE